MAVHPEVIGKGMNNENYEQDYLMHYGRLKMHWGVQHGPPYPLPEGAFEGAPKAVVESKLSLQNKAKDLDVSVGKYARLKANQMRVRSLSLKASKEGDETKRAEIEKRLSKAKEKGNNVYYKELEKQLKERQKDINDKKVSARDMSDEELDSAIKRLQKEETYARLIGEKTKGMRMNEARDKSKKNREWVEDKVKTVAGNVIVPVATGYALYKIEQSLGKSGKISSDDISKIINGGKGGKNNNQQQGEKKNKNKNKNKP